MHSGCRIMENTNITGKIEVVSEVPCFLSASSSAAVRLLRWLVLVCTSSSCFSKFTAYAKLHKSNRISLGEGLQATVFIYKILP
jgi:hypothetical protein